jgi:hypothetical protein
MKRLAKALLYMLVIVILIASFMYGETISFSSQLKIYGVMLTVASIVFAIMGAWLSLLKVEIESGVEEAGDNDEGDAVVAKARNIIDPMNVSSMIIVVTLIIGFFYYSFKDEAILLQFLPYIRSISYSIVTGLFILQIITLTKVMFSGVDFIIVLSRKNADLKADRKRIS